VSYASEIKELFEKYGKIVTLPLLVGFGLGYAFENHLVDEERKNLSTQKALADDRRADFEKQVDSKNKDLDTFKAQSATDFTALRLSKDQEIASLKKANNLLQDQLTSSQKKVEQYEKPKDSFISELTRLKERGVPLFDAFPLLNGRYTVTADEQSGLDMCLVSVSDTISQDLPTKYAIRKGKRETINVGSRSFSLLYRSFTGNTCVVDIQLLK
jgi:hypothetical protein